MEITAVICDVRTRREAQISFPMSEEAIKARLGLDSGSDFEYIFVDGASDLIGEMDNIDTVNRFSEVVEGYEEDLVRAVVEATGYKAKDFVTEGFDFSSVTYLPDVATNQGVGEYYVEEQGFASLSREILETYFDYEAYGRDIVIEQSGGLTSHGYVTYDE